MSVCFCSFNLSNSMHHKAHNSFLISEDASLKIAIGHITSVK